MDAKVREARRSGDPAAAGVALLDAIRFRESGAVCEQLLRSAPGAAHHFAMCAFIHPLAGRPGDAKASAARALALDPEASVPSWAK